MINNSCIGPYVQLKSFLMKYVPINAEYFASKLEINNQNIMENRNRANSSNVNKSV